MYKMQIFVVVAVYWKKKIYKVDNTQLRERAGHDQCRIRRTNSRTRRNAYELPGRPGVLSSAAPLKRLASSRD
jgi:hypothetical protein